MGAANVGLVFTRWTALPDRAFRLLVYMALVSLDADSPPRCWVGRDALARAMQPRASDNAAYVAVRAALHELQQAGAIERTVNAKPGQRAEYALKLWAPPMAQGQPAPNGAGSRDAMVQGEVTNGAGSACTMAQGQPAPDENSGLTGTRQEEITSRSHVQRRSA